jgi:alpha-acetolactate decarboxylase
MLARATAVFALSLLSSTALEPRTFGDIGRLVRDHDTKAKVTLGDVLAKPHTYGLGSLSGLRGEITLLDGQAWLSYPPARDGDKPRVVTAGNASETAAFLVTTQVDAGAWKKVTLRGALTSRDVDAQVAKLAIDNGLAGRDFAFRVDGTFQSLTLAIADGRRLPPGPGTEASMKQINALQTLGDVSGSLVGFFSPDSTSSFTHAGAHTHVHAVVPAKPATGHAQDFTVAPGATLWLQVTSPRAPS